MNAENGYSHKVGDVYVEHLNGISVRFTVAECLAADENHEWEVVLTAQGRVLLCDVDQRAYTLYPTKEALVADLSTKVYRRTMRQLFDQLGGSITVVPEV